MHQYELSFIKLLAFEGAKESPLNPDRGDCKNIYEHEGFIFKVYFFDDMLENQSKLLYVQNEYAVLKQSAEKQMKHLAHLKGIFLGRNHVALKL